MGKKAFVFSTLATDVKYTEWHPAPDSGGMAIEGRSVLVRGGTGVMNDRLVTPHGICTEIDEEDIPMLEANEVFKLHKKNGFVKIEKKESEAEKVAADMNTADPSSPKTPASYPDEGDGAKPAAANR